MKRSLFEGQLFERETSSNGGDSEAPHISGRRTEDLRQYRPVGAHVAACDKEVILFRYFLAQDRDDFLSSKPGVRNRHSHKYKSSISGFLKFFLHGGRSRGGEEFVVVSLL